MYIRQRSPLICLTLLKSLTWYIFGGWNLDPVALSVSSRLVSPANGSGTQRVQSLQQDTATIPPRTSVDLWRLLADTVTPSLIHTELSVRMSRRVPLVESEKSRVVVGRHWKQNTVLRKELQVLDRAKQTVGQRITLNQRVTYKQHKERVYQAKLTLAKILGDKEAERETRARAQAYKFNTNFGQDPEDEEVLQKIWARGTTAPAAAADGDGEGINGASPTRRCASTRSANSLRPASRLGSALLGTVPARRLPAVRPQTVAAASRHRSIDIVLPCTSQYINTGTYSATPRSQNSSDSEEGSSSSPSLKPRPKTAPGTTTAHRNSLAIPRRLSTAGGKDSIFEKDNERPSLLDLHLQCIKLANYEDQVDKFCQRMAPYRVEKEYLIEDYYAVSMDCICKQAAGPNYSRAKVLEDSESDIRRSVGNPYTRSMTMKTLEVPNCENHPRQDKHGT